MGCLELLSQVKSSPVWTRPSLRLCDHLLADRASCVDEATEERGLPVELTERDQRLRLMARM